jgi:hypothetical protein
MAATRSRAVWCIAVAIAAGAGAAPAAGLTWSAPALIDPPPALVNADDLSGVSCPSTHLCVAVDQSGNVLSTGSPLGGLAQWHVTSLHPGRGTAELTGVSCPGPGCA